MRSNLYLFLIAVGLVWAAVIFWRIILSLAGY